MTGKQNSEMHGSLFCAGIALFCFTTQLHQNYMGLHIRLKLPVSFSWCFYLSSLEDFARQPLDLLVNYVLVPSFCRKPPKTLFFLPISPQNLFLAQIMRFSSVLGVLYIQAIVVTRRIVLDQFSVLFLCIDVLFLSFCSQQSNRKYSFRLKFAQFAWRGWFAPDMLPYF